MYWKRMILFFVLCHFITLAPITAQSDSKPFILPVTTPPGPSTWLFGQPYGNTVGAFVRGREWYEAGQRLHFGIDISMPCGTPLVAMADGVVDYVDDFGFGAGPHNLLIRHDQVGVIILYGHLRQRPQLTPGQPVAQGEVVAHSGDPDVTCDSRPHLHLEVRGPTYRTAYNPVSYIEANWHVLAGIGSFSSRSFMQNLDNARQWMSLDDQPDVAFGGAPLNDYAAPYPDTSNGSPPSNPPLPRAPQPQPDGEWSMRRLTFDGCCPGAWWHPTQANLLYVIDGAPGQRAGIFEWNTDDGSLVTLVGQAPPPYLSADGAYSIERRGDQFAVRRLVDNAETLVNTNGEWPSLNADDTRLIWMVGSEIPLPGEDRPLVDIWTADADGANTRIILSETGISAQWLDNTRLLVTKREEITTTIRVFDTANDAVFSLGAWNWLRSLSVAPGGGRLMFYTVYDPDPTLNGIYTIETQPEAQARLLDWFGAWRWRDADSVFYLPLNPSSPLHTLHYYHVPTGEDRTLTDPTTTPFTVANGDWSVSPDGDQIVFWNAQDLTLGILESRTS
jgi:hypothetical protein